MELPIDAACGRNLAKVTELLHKAFASAGEVQNFPEPEILYCGLEASSIRIAIFLRAAGPRWRLMQARLRCRMLEIFCENGIEIPFNQSDVTANHI